MASDFSTLPLELLADIAFKLGSFEDFINFSAVCRSWNRTSSSIKHIWRATPSVPWLLLTENPKHNPNCLRNIINLNDNKRYSLNLPQTFGTRCWGSPYGWLAMVDRNFDVQLFNPITKACLSFPNIGPLDTTEEELTEEYISEVLVYALVRLTVLKLSLNGHDEYVVVVVYDFNKLLAFARHGDQSWTTISIVERDRVIDVVGVDDNVFALYYDGSVRYWKVNDFNGLELIKPQYYSTASVEIVNILTAMMRDIHSVYMVQSGRGLLMVLRFKEGIFNIDNSDFDYDIVYKTVGFKVYKLEPKDKSWVEHDDLGEVALFVGGNSSMCVSVEHAQGLQPNCIYFTDDEGQFWDLPKEKGGHDMGVYDNKDGKLWRFYEGDDIHSSICPPTFFIPQF